MLQGTQETMLKGVATSQIHGETYYDILYGLGGGERGTARVSREVIYPDPQAGDRVMLHFLMGMVTRVEKKVGG